MLADRQTYKQTDHNTASLMGGVIINQYLHPRGAVLRGEFEELLVQFATSVKLS